jgi:hypothetical protein
MPENKPQVTGTSEAPAASAEVSAEEAQRAEKLVRSLERVANGAFANDQLVVSGSDGYLVARLVTVDKGAR